MNNKELQSYYDGYSVKAYDIFGAHFVEGGVVFRLYAPNAKSVRLIGDFNNWDREATFLKKINNEIWETTVGGLQEYAQYKYVIESQDGKLMEKVDPYAFYNEMRPGWVCKVVNLDEYKWTDEEWMKNRTLNFDKPMNIYEVHLGGFKHHGAGRWFTYYEMIDELIPYVKEMGYTHIELMPLNEYPFDGSWGYQQYGYFSVTSRYGNCYQLMMFIDACHKNGIGVIMDIVMAHFVKDSFGLIKFDGTCVYENSDPSKSESQWDTHYFDFAKNEVVSFLMSSAGLWLDKYHMDGLRVDAVSNLIYYNGDSTKGENNGAIAFIKRFNYHLHANYPGAMIIAEDSTSYPRVTEKVEYGGLGFDYKWDLGWMNDTLRYYKMDPEYRKYHHNLINFSMAYFYSEKFILPFSHDEVVHSKGTIVDKMWGNYEEKFAQCRNLMVYMYTHPGKKLNFMGNEIASFREFDEQKELDWFLLTYPAHDSFKRMIRDLNEIYKSDEAFWKDDYSWDGFKWIDADNNEQRIYSYVRFGREYVYVVVLNMAPVSYEEFELGVPTYGYYTEILNSEKDIYSGCNMCNFTKVQAKKPGKNGMHYSMKIRLAPYAGVILRAKRK
ncbi:MAG: 1,4-alpha-glucan branching protein GlgB [Erysipelotrichaceae bacterium]|nr:1,4-alpha-glucan branching protein GlgB [Erysipelotrichaceae bacterium]